jgi:hypothetical protein
MLVEKDNFSNLVRQQGSSAILNIDATGFNQYRQERKRILKTDQLAQEMQLMQKDMSEIKMLLQQLVNGK